MLPELFHRPLRLAVAALYLAGVGLSGLASVLAFARVGTGQGMVFAVVTVALGGAAVAVVRTVRWVLAVTVVVLGAQLPAVGANLWQLARGIDTGKAAQLRRLGFDPTLGVVLNLIYSAICAVVFGWLVCRWYRWRHHRRMSRPAAGEDAGATTQITGSRMRSSNGA